jgi:hypothetical protein
MLRKTGQTSLFGAIPPRLYAASPAHSVRGFNRPQKCAIFCSNLGSSGECRIKWHNWSSADRGSAHEHYQSSKPTK